MNLEHVELKELVSLLFSLLTFSAHSPTSPCHAPPLLKDVEPFQLKDGHLIVPDKPGQGIEWDEKAVAKFSI